MLTLVKDAAQDTWIRKWIKTGTNPDRELLLPLNLGRDCQALDHLIGLLHSIPIKLGTARRPRERSEANTFSEMGLELNREKDQEAKRIA